MNEINEINEVKIANPPAHGITPKQHAVLQFIQRYIHQHRYAPSYREIMHHFQWTSPASVTQYIRALEKKGALTVNPHAHRGIQPAHIQKSTESAPELQIPWIGNLSIGYPLELFIHPQMIAVPPHLVHSPDNTYLIQVQGDALHSECIQDGDLLLIESRQNILPGEMILGLINQTDSVLKRYYPEGQSVRLESQNSQNAPLTLRYEHIALQGVLIGLLRSY